MKKFIVFMLLVALYAGAAFAAWSSAVSGKTTVGTNYLSWGTFTDITQETRSITTGLTTIRAFGVNVNTAESFVATGESDSVYAKAIGGVISLKSHVSGALRDGTWWAIGR